MAGAIGDPGATAAARAPEDCAPAARLQPGRPRGGYESRGARIASIVFTGIWLLYLIGPVVDLFTQHHTAMYTWAGFTIIMVFSVIYLTLVPRWPTPPRYALRGLAALCAPVELSVFGTHDVPSQELSTLTSVYRAAGARLKLEDQSLTDEKVAAEILK